MFYAFKQSLSSRSYLKLLIYFSNMSAHSFNAYI